MRQLNARLKREGKVHALVVHESVHDWAVGRLSTFDDDPPPWPKVVFARTGCKDIVMHLNVVESAINKQNPTLPAPWSFWRTQDPIYRLQDKVVNVSVARGQVIITVFAENSKTQDIVRGVSSFSGCAQAAC
jgi:hypothetical protein